MTICLFTCQDILVGSLFIGILETSFFFNLVLDVISISRVKMCSWFLTIYLDQIYCIRKDFPQKILDKCMVIEDARPICKYCLPMKVKL